MLLSQWHQGLAQCYHQNHHCPSTSSSPCHTDGKVWVIYAVFQARPAYDTICQTLPFSVAPGLDSVLSTPWPPSIDFFNLLSQLIEKLWAIYAVLISHPTHKSLLYIGLDSHAGDNVRARQAHCPRRSGLYVRHPHDSSYGSINPLHRAELPRRG